MTIKDNQIYQNRTLGLMDKSKDENWRYHCVI